MSAAKAAEPIEMPFGMLTWVGHVSDGFHIPQGKVQFFWVGEVVAAQQIGITLLVVLAIAGLQHMPKYCMLGKVLTVRQHTSATFKSEDVETV